MRAADAGTMRSVEFLIKRHVDLAIVDRDKKTALFHAAENNQTDVLSRLLLEGADPNIRADFGITPLMAAAEKGHSIAAEILLEEYANIDDADPINGLTALMLAASNGHADVVSVLVSRGADITRTDLAGQTPLMMAARAGIASSLLGGMSRQRKKGRTEYINARDTKGKTALIYAAEKSDKREVELLLRLGVDVNIQDNDKRSAIINVAASPQKDTYVKQAVLSALVRARNANLDLQDNENKTALMRAIEIGDVETVKTLIYYGARIDVESKPGETALTVARDILRNTSMQKEFMFIVRLLESWPKRTGQEHK
jgi:ankyrin repeat protein